MSRPAIHRIANPKAWTVLVAPVRIEVVEVMRMIAPCSIAEIATALDRPADTLYRHLEKLKRAGAVVEAGVRRIGRRVEQVYDLVADDFRVDFKDGSGRTANKAYNDTMQSIIKVASRTARDSSAAGQLLGVGEERNIMGKIEHAWLTQEQFIELRELMMKVKSFMDAHKSHREGRLYLAALIAMPVTRKRGAKRAAESAPKPALKSATKPAAKVVAKPAAKVVAKPAAKVVAKSAAKSSTKRSKK
jgi:DNA-binding transcriptional ArsR family regulator